MTDPVTRDEQKRDVLARFRSPLDALVQYALDLCDLMVVRLGDVLRMEDRESTVTFHPGPDFSVSSNAHRMADGFAYGGILSWTTSQRIAFPGLRPNACGVLLCRFDSGFEESIFLHRLLEAQQRYHAHWDYSVGNHFVAVYCDSEQRFYGLLHGGSSLTKKSGLNGSGFYPETSDWLRQHTQNVSTPSGQVSVLKGDVADEYFAGFQQAEATVKSRREDLCQYLWPASQIVFHATHQGLYDSRTALLGAYALPRNTAGSVVPIMIGPGEDIPVCSAGISLGSLPCLFSGERSFPPIQRDDILFCPHGSGDTNINVKALTHDIGPMIIAQLKNGGRVLFNGTIPTPNQRTRDDVDFFLSQSGLSFAQVLRHVISFKV